MNRPGTDDVAEAVLLASRVLVAVAARSLEASDVEVTLPQFRALVVMATRGPQSLSALAQDVGATPSSASRLCDRLIAKGLIDRQPAAHSRREIELTITDSGRAAFESVQKVRRREIAKVVSSIPSDRWETIVSALREFAEAGGEQHAPAIV